MDRGRHECVDDGAQVGLRDERGQWVSTQQAWHNIELCHDVVHQNFCVVVRVAEKLGGRKTQHQRSGEREHIELNARRQ